MKAFTIIALLIAGLARAEPSSDPFDGELHPIDPRQTMSADEVASYATPYTEAVAACYQANVQSDPRPSGDLALYVVISRTGKVVYSEVSAKDIEPEDRLPLERCVTHEVSTWQFPTRSGFTNTTIPYMMLHTSSPASGIWTSV